MFNIFIKISWSNIFRMVSCSAGECSIEGCGTGCYCWSDSKNPSDCSCECDHPHTKPASKKGRYKTRLKFSPKARYNFSARKMPITSLAQSLDKSLPNRILVPANKLTKKVSLSLKNKTFRQIIIASGLALKS